MKVNTQTSDQGPPQENEAEKIKMKALDHSENGEETEKKREETDRRRYEIIWGCRDKLMQ